MIWNQPYVSRSSVASASYSSEGMVEIRIQPTKGKKDCWNESRIQDPNRLMEAFFEQATSVDEAGYHVSLGILTD